MASDWQSSQEFLAAQPPPLMAIPWKKSRTDAELAAQEPQLKCPKCDRLIEGLQDSQVPITGVQTGMVMTWRFYPCNCICTSASAGAFTAEVYHRRHNGVPTDVLAKFKAAPPPATQKLMEMGVPSSGYEYLGSKLVNPSEIAAKALDPGKGWPTKSPLKPNAQLQTLPSAAPPSVQHQTIGGAYAVAMKLPADYGFKLGDKVKNQNGEIIGVIMAISPLPGTGQIRAEVQLCEPPPSIVGGIQKPIPTIGMKQPAPISEDALFKAAPPAVVTAAKAHRQAVLDSLGPHRRKISKPPEE